MENILSYCGVDCSECPDCIYGRCPGCKLTKWTKESICMPVECCKKQRIPYCGKCSNFPCEDMKSFYTESESHKKAYAVMQKIAEKSKRE